MLLNRFAKDRNGNVATMFALAIVPIIGFVGAAIDFGRAATLRTSLQAAIDSAALTLSKEAAGLTSAQLSQKATDYVTAQFNRPEAKNLAITVSYATAPSKLTLGGSATVDTAFMKVLGIQKMDIGSSTTVQWGMSRLRVALVLDNTGSMASSGKMTALKTATKNLLTQLKNAAVTNGDIYVSIIPFSKAVNVGASNYNQSWIRWDLWDAANGSFSGGCNGWGWGNGGCSGWGAGGGTWVADNHNTWNGCVTDRDQDYDTKNTAPAAGTSATLFPAEQYSACPVAMMGLSYDWNALSGKVDAMQPDGNTNQAIGLQWGWQSLTSAPFTIPAKDPNYQYQDVIILLSDGLNTQDRWYTNQASIDARQKLTCDNVRAAKITLYTVQVNTGGDATSTLLQQCATDSGKFFLLTSANQMVSTFNQIGTTLSKLYISK